MSVVISISVAGIVPRLSRTHATSVVHIIGWSIGITIYDPVPDTPIVIPVVVATLVIVAKIGGISGSLTLAVAIDGCGCVINLMLLLLGQHRRRRRRR